MKHRFYVWLGLALAGSACGGGGGSGNGKGDDLSSPDAAVPSGEADVRVLHYDYAFATSTRTARAELTLVVDSAGDCVTLPVRTFSVANVTFDGVAASSHEVVDERLVACREGGWQSGTEVVLAADVAVENETWGQTQVGYSAWTDAEDQPFLYLVSWVGGCDRFAPCDNRADRFATYTFRVRHPDEMRVLCPGQITAGEGETVCEFSHAGGPTYSTFGFAASPSWVEVDLGDWGGVQATLYDMPSVDLAGDFDAALHADFLAWMTEHFGPYPYGDELRFAVGPTYWNGFEHPGNIVLSDTLPNQLSPFPDQLAHTTNHEIAHQWAGDQTTLASVHDFVWKEAMVEYLAFVFEDEEMGQALARASAGAWESSARRAEYWPVPAEKPPLLDYYGDVYGAGPMVLFRQLEAIYDRPSILAALARLLGNQRAIGVADVQTALEQELGVELGDYFDAWVYGEGVPTWPIFDLSWVQAEGGEVLVTVSQQAAAEGLFGAAFTVQLTGGTEEDPETFDARFDLGVDGAATATETASPGFEVTGAIFDPYHETLAQVAEASNRPAPVAVPDGNPWVAPRRPVRHPGAR